MLSSSETNISRHLFSLNRHCSLMTQPALGARSRKKNQFDPITPNHRNPSNDSPSFISSLNQVKVFMKEVVAFFS